MLVVVGYAYQKKSEGNFIYSQDKNGTGFSNIHRLSNAAMGVTGQGLRVVEFVNSGTPGSTPSIRSGELEQ